MDRVQYVRQADKRKPSIVAFAVFWISANALFTALVAGAIYLIYEADPMNRAAILFCLIVAGLLSGAMVKRHSTAKPPVSKEFYIKSAAIVRASHKE